MKSFINAKIESTTKISMEASSDFSSQNCAILNLYFIVLRNKKSQSLLSFIWKQVSIGTISF